MYGSVVSDMTNNIHIHKLVPPENHDLFSRFPELNLIWEVPVLQQHARESYEGWDTRKYEGETDGEIFAIMEGEQAVGITGWFEYGDIPDVLRLRYYGIVPSRRGLRYGDEAMHQLLGRLSSVAPPQYKWLAESVSIERTTAPNVIAHFKRMGFEEFSDPNYGSNAGCGKTQSLRIRIPGR